MGPGLVTVQLPPAIETMPRGSTLEVFQFAGSTIRLRAPPDTCCVVLEFLMQTRLGAGGSMKSNRPVMKSNSALTLVQSIYDHVHLALWATLAAFIVFYLAFIVPKLPELAARAEALRVQEIAQENGEYCSRWQMSLGTKMHDQCISDLQELRWKIQDRLADRLVF
jgi:hypothetical protein